MSLYTLNAPIILFLNREIMKECLITPLMKLLLISHPWDHELQL